MLRSVAKRLDADQLRPTNPTGDPTTFNAQEPTTFIALPIACSVDDFVVIILSDIPAEFKPKAETTFEAIASGLAQHGIQVNDSQEKTEAMFHDRGPDFLLATQAQGQPSGH